MSDFDNHDLDSTQYLIPANVTARFELWEGFGWKELKYCLLALIIGFALYFISGLFVRTVIFDINELPVEETIGLQNDDNVKIEGNIVTKKENIIPNGIRFLFIVIPTCLTYFCVKRDSSTGLSLIDNIIYMKEFKKSQKLYLYKYGSGSEG